VRRRYKMPGRILDVKFSKSDLYTEHYKDLLDFIIGRNSSDHRYVDIDAIVDLVDTKAPNGKSVIVIREIIRYTTGVVKL